MDTTEHCETWPCNNTNHLCHMCLVVRVCRAIDVYVVKFCKMKVINWKNCECRGSDDFKIIAALHSCTIKQALLDILLKVLHYHWDFCANRGDSWRFYSRPWVLQLSRVRCITHQQHNMFRRWNSRLCCQTNAENKSEGKEVAMPAR